MAELSLRPATAEDDAFLRKVYEASRAEEIAQWGWPAQQQEMFLRMQYNARKQGYAASFPGAAHSILLDTGRPAGSMIVFRSSSQMRLIDIALLPEYRGHGIGGQIISDLIREAGNLKLPLRLSVACGNPAIHLYRRLGFVSLGSDAMYIEMERVPTSD